MNITEQALLGYLASFLWPFFRISSIFITIPVFSVRAVPARLRIMASTLITFVILPTLPAMPEADLFSYSGMLITVQQLLIGLASGFILQMAFSVMLLAGQTIAYSMGLGFASMVDPATGLQVPVIGQLFVIATSLAFLGVDGHLMLIEMLAQSFHTLPVGRQGLEVADIWRIVAWSSEMFIGGVLLALPIMATLLFVNLSFGVASKAAPQLQIFGVGFPITILLGMVLIWIGISTMVDVFDDILHDTFVFVSGMLRLT